jgi:hypothetical protein
MQSILAILETAMYYVMFPLMVFLICFYVTLGGLPGLADRFNIPVLFAGIAAGGLSVWAANSDKAATDPNFIPFHIMLGVAALCLVMAARGLRSMRSESDSTTAD